MAATVRIRATRKAICRTRETPKLVLGIVWHMSSADKEMNAAPYDEFGQTHLETFLWRRHAAFPPNILVFYGPNFQDHETRWYVKLDSSQNVEHI